MVSRDRLQEMGEADSAAKVSAVNLEKRFEDTLDYHRDKSAQKGYLSTISEIESDLLSRTIFVTNVKDLSRESNLAALKWFFEMNYGPVEECVAVESRKPHHSFPPARVRFFSKRDAEKLFGKELIMARTVQASVYPTGCLIAHGNAIRVRPSDPYTNMVEETISGSSVVFRGATIALGHWFSARVRDGYNIVSAGDERERGNLWLEELAVPYYFPSMKVDFLDRTVKIEWHHEDEGAASRIMEQLSYYSKHFISFRFKDLLGPMELFPSESALFFSLKYPPKLYKSSVYEGERDDERLERQVEMCGIDTCHFGSCLGYMLTLDRPTISILRANTEAMENMRRFGIWKNGSARRSLGRVSPSTLEKTNLEWKLRRIKHFKVGG